MTRRSSRLFRRIRDLLLWGSRDRDMHEEMQFHLEALAQEYLKGGLPEAEARLAARRQFGNLTRLKERGHDERTMRSAEDVARDVRHAARGLCTARAFRSL
jgi:hypothetical protein